jgi:hypothetical protein
MNPAPKSLDRLAEEIFYFWVNQARICRLSPIIIIMVFLAVNQSRNLSLCQRPGCPSQTSILSFQKALDLQMNSVLKGKGIYHLKTQGTIFKAEWG